MHPVFAFIDAPIILVILGLGVLLFGADRIPKLAKSMGEAKKEFEAASARSAAPTPPPASDPQGAAPQTPPAQPPPN
jgi:sec-independent protein translocase protein TatA